jgi:hypothetical protein
MEEANTMRNLTELLADTEERKAEQIESLLAGLDDLDAYEGSRPHQCFSILMPFPVYLQFRGLNKKLRGESVKKEDPDIRRNQSFTVKLPFPLFLQFKKLTQELRGKVPATDKDRYTMTAWVNVATAKVVLPALDELILRAREDTDFRSAIDGNKDKFTMTSWVTASIEKNIVPALREAIRHAEEVVDSDSKAA